MAVPKQKRSRSRTHHKRAKIYKAFSVSVTNCPNCGAPKQPHRVCLRCGYYGKKQVFEVAK